MRLMAVFITIILGLMPACGSASAANANNEPANPPATRPVKPARIKTELKIHAQNVAMAHLRIPASVLASLSGENRPQASARLNRTQTWIAGIAVSAALGAGGMQLVRRRSGVGMRTVALSLFAGGIALAASAAWADIAPPPKPIGVPPIKVGLPGEAGLQVPVAIDIGGEGDQIVLVLSTVQANNIQNYVINHTSTHAAEPMDDPKPDAPVNNQK